MALPKPKPDGTVSRVVSGRLLYVDSSATHETLALTPDKLMFRGVDGRLTRYRGEPFEEVGIRVGANVDFEVDGKKVKKVIINRPAHPKTGKHGFRSLLKFPGLR